MRLLFTLIAGFGAAAALTPLVRMLALRSGVVDSPTLPRKMHKKTTPLLGGLAVVAALIVTVVFAVSLHWLPGAHIKAGALVGLGLALAILVIGGMIDDKFDLPPSLQIVSPVIASLVAIAAGVGTEAVTNPFGGLIHLGALSGIFTFAWLMGMTYTTKFLDGLDGLVAGVSGIGALVVAAVSMMVEVAQPDTAVLALAFAGVCGGFLIYNFHPASIFLGEGGSTACGFMLGALAIISGGKIATTLLVLGLPILDTAIVIVRRFVEGRSPWRGDRSHLHFRLLDIGFTHEQAVLFMYFVAALFGASTLVLRGTEKLAALLVIACLLLALAAAGAALRKKHKI